MTMSLRTPRAGLLRRIWPACIFLAGASSVVLFGASDSYQGQEPIPTLLVGSDGSATSLASRSIGATDELESNTDQPLEGEIVLMEVTAYCPCVKCCGPRAKGVTASGVPVSYNGGEFVAADTEHFPFGTRLVIPGYGDEEVVEVVDRGGAIKGMKLDVYYPEHATAKRWGRQILPVRVLPPILQ